MIAQDLNIYHDNSGIIGRWSLYKREKYNFYVLYTSARFNPVVPWSRHARGGPKQMGFEEEAAVFLTENVFREGFLVIFCLYVAWDEKSCERIQADGENDSFLRCMFVVGSAGWLTDVPRRRCARSVWRHGRIWCLSSCTNSFLWPLSLRVATYEHTSVFRGRGNIHRTGVRSQQGLILDVDTESSGSLRR